MSEKLLLTPREAGELLGYKLTVVYQMVREGEIEAVCPRGKRGLRIPRRSLEEYVDRLIQDRRETVAAGEAQRASEDRLATEFVARLRGRR